MSPALLLMNTTRCSVIFADFCRSLAAVPVGIAMAASLVMPGYALEFPDTGDRGAPSTTVGGGTREGTCPDIASETATRDPYLLALLPRNSVNTFAGEQASLMILVDPAFNQMNAEIFVQDAQTQAVIYQEEMTLEILENGDSIQIDLPAHNAAGEPLLQKEQTYTWEFAVICSTSNRTQDHYISGWIEPVSVSPELSEQLAVASPLEQAELYAAAGIWQETLTLAAQLMTQSPTPMLDLLASVGFGESLTQTTRLCDSVSVETDSCTQGSTNAGNDSL